MPLSLPTVEDEYLPGSPLDLVVCQVRFPEVPAISDSRLMRDLLARLPEYQKVSETVGQQTQVQIDPVLGSSQFVSALRGWRLQSSDTAWAVVVSPTSISVETATYGRWDEFSKRVLDVFTAVSDLVDPAVEQRLGLRYVDRITAEGRVYEAKQWSGIINDDLLGPLTNSNLNDAVGGHEGRLLLNCTDSIGATLRYGSFAEEGPGRPLSYLLDFDVYRERAEPFSVDDIATALTEFHEISLKLFQECITGAYYEKLKGGGEK